MAKQKELFGSSIVANDTDWKDTMEPVYEWKTGTGSGHPAGQRCYHTHPAYKLVVGGKEYEVFGGSCSHPAVEDADIYIGFDAGMRPSGKVTPWGTTEEYLTIIPDMGVPASAQVFKQYVEWAAAQVVAGKKLHCGCIGGHGRTGMFLAALCKTMTGEEDAITHVRKNYCEKVVESAKQVDWLHEHFGIKKVVGSKAGISTGNSISPGLYKTYTGTQPKGSKKGYQSNSPTRQTINFMSSGHLWK